jgi:cytochrome c-type biogenesis protein CcmH/NrfG
MAHNAHNQARPALTVHSYILAVFCMIFGFVLGYLFRGPASPAATPVAATASPATASTGGGAANTSLSSQSDALGHTASVLLDNLKTNPNDFETLVKLGNLYYDGQQYQNATLYYERALKLHPENPDVRTDMGTCYWNLGAADKALDEFNKALTYRPDYPQTLFNMGIVKFEGKNDAKGAIETWERLLKTNPNYPQKQQVLDLIARAKNQAKG